MPPRILVLSASVGAGHLRAAQAVELALREVAARGHGPQRRCAGIDQRPVSPALRQGLPRPGQQGAARPRLFLRPDGPAQPLRQEPHATACAWPSRNSTCASSSSLLKDEPWDLVINTHFLPAEIIASLRKKGELQLAAGDGDHRLRDASPLGQSAVRALFHGHRRRALATCSTGACPPADTTVTGIPIHPRVQPSRRTAPSAWPGTDWPAIGPSSCSCPAASASVPSTSCIAGSADVWNGPSNWSRSPAATRR